MMVASTVTNLSESLGDRVKRLRDARRLTQEQAVLGTALQAAVGLGVIAASPLARVPRPVHHPRPRVAWTLDDAARFHAAAVASPSPHAPLLLLLLHTGLRLSEALALTEASLDRDQGTVRVQRALVRVAGKTASAGERVVGVPAAVLNRYTPGIAPPYTTLRDALTRLCQRAGVPVLPPHGLRHVHASVLIAQGVDVATVSRRLGHAQISTTVNLYTHPMQADALAVAALTRVLLPDGGN